MGAAAAFAAFGVLFAVKGFATFSIAAEVLFCHSPNLSTSNLADTGNNSISRAVSVNLIPLCTYNYARLYGLNRMENLQCFKSPAS